jgi:hypothetical protein
MMAVFEDPSTGFIIINGWHRGDCQFSFAAALDTLLLQPDIELEESQSSLARQLLV